MTLKKYKAYIPIPGDIIALKVMFVNSGFNLYLVGGAIRDFVLDKPIKDYDLATDATPEEIKDILDEHDVKYILVGEQFGVVNAIMHDTYEIATFREDSSSGDGRRPDSVKYSTIEADVLRRDLTMNALYFDIHTQEILDYVGGYDDIKNGVVRTVGNPEDRFNEDKLRILRAIRFACRTGKELDSRIKEFLSNEYDLIGVSKERIRDEFIKSIQSAKSTKHLMRMLADYNLFEWIFPDLKINKHFIDSNDEIIVISYLLIYNSPYRGLSKDLNKLTYTINEIRDIRFLMSLKDLSVKTAPSHKANQKDTRVSEAQIIEFASILNVEKKLIDAFLKYEPSINGSYVMSKYNITGPEVGKMINQLEIERFNAIYTEAI
jgi:tRNA nucleotidyltransferase/poly(A) polymerase